ncbi:hypothetical protein OK016_02055 [Vibrio chagasii]|nr:hypothetical protein [Vibrio chagasii]
MQGLALICSVSALMVAEAFGRVLVFSTGGGGRHSDLCDGLETAALLKCALWLWNLRFCCSRYAHLFSLYWLGRSKPVTTGMEAVVD